MTRWLFHRRAPLAFLALACALLIKAASGLLPAGERPVAIRRLDPPTVAGRVPAASPEPPGSMDMRSAPGGAFQDLQMDFPKGDWRPTEWSLALPDARFVESGGRLMHRSVRLPFLPGGAAYQIEMRVPGPASGAAIRTTGRLAASAWIDGRPMKRDSDGNWSTGALGPEGGFLRVRVLSLRAQAWSVTPARLSNPIQ